jgi:hypothetical protein
MARYERDWFHGEIARLEEDGELSRSLDQTKSRIS